MKATAWPAAVTDQHDASEEARIIALACNDPEQFKPLYERYFDRVYLYCLKRTGNHQDAEDLCSQVFVRVLKSLHTFKPEGYFAAWLFRIAHNVVYDFYQRRKPVVHLDNLDWPDEEAFISLESIESAHILADLVAQLPENHRELLSLSINAGLNSQEIGQVLGKRPGTVRVQLHRIIKTLRHQYFERMGSMTDE